MSSKSKWWRIPPNYSLTENEYDANMRGMNIVFGAVLGFVMAGADQLPPEDFAVVLLFSASTVVTILYLAMSDYKLFYGATAAGAIIALPFVLDEMFKIDPIPQLQPTLAVWALMIVIVEIMPRESEENSKENKT